METNNTKLETGLKIHTFRDAQVMLDKDLAILYGIQTKRLIEQVKRNLDRFPESFMFQLSVDEISRSQFATLKNRVNSGVPEPISNSRSQIATLKNQSLKRARGEHFKYRPFVFTEHGVAMLSSVLKSPTAIETSIYIIESFVKYRNQSSRYIVLFQQMEQMKNQITDHESSIKKILQKLEPTFTQSSGIFFNDQIFDAYVFSSELIAKAKRSIILIDNYIDETTLLQLSKRNRKVSCTIYTEKITEQLKLDLEKHNAQYPSIEIRILKNAHDRFWNL